MVVMPCGWVVKLGVIRVWMASKTIWFITHGPYLSLQRCFTIKRSINSHLLCLLCWGFTAAKVGLMYSAEQLPGYHSWFYRS